MAITKLEKMINPQVMADMISAKVEKRVAVTPFAKVDSTLVGQAGNTITVPAFTYIGDGSDVAEGASIGASELTTSEKQYTIKKVGKGVDLTDEAIMSGYGDPIGEATNQLSKAIAQKVDQDAMDALYTGTLTYDGSSSAIAYNGIIDAIDVLEEEYNSEKVIFIHPKQLTKLRKDSNFLSADQYVNGNYIQVNGEIGKIANCRVVVSKRVAESDDTLGYKNPIVKLTWDAETEADTPALTIFLKKGVLVETDRDIDTQVNMIRATENYVVALTDESKVVVATFKK